MKIAIIFDNNTQKKTWKKLSKALQHLSSLGYKNIRPMKALDSEAPLRALLFHSILYSKLDEETWLRPPSILKVGERERGYMG